MEITGAALDAGGMVIGGADAALFVTFYNKAVNDGARTKEQGRPCFRDRLYVRIRVPGDRTMEVDRPADEDDQRRFPRQYQNFLNLKPDEIVGTPIEEVPWLAATQVAELKAMNIHSLENLAAVNDTQLPKLGLGARALRDKAQVFMKAAADGAVVIRQQEQIQKQTDRIEQLEATIAELGAKFEAISEAPRGPGRPRKEAAAA